MITQIERRTGDLIRVDSSGMATECRQGRGGRGKQLPLCDSWHRIRDAEDVGDIGREAAAPRSGLGGRGPECGLQDGPLRVVPQPLMPAMRAPAEANREQASSVWRITYLGPRRLYATALEDIHTVSRRDFLSLFHVMAS